MLSSISVKILALALKLRIQRFNTSYSEEIYYSISLCN